MKVRYKVKLNNPKKADHITNHVTKDGYLMSFGRTATYTRGEAIKKARMFDGKIERVEETFIVTDAKIAQIHENNLLKGVLKQLQGREMFVDADPHNEERMYSADVFEQILSEQDGLEGSRMAIQNEEVIAQLEELADALGEYQYVQLTII